MLVREALAWARTQGVARLDAQLLLAHQLPCDRAWLIAHDDHAIDDTAQMAFQRGVALRVDEVPLAYLLGRREFHGLDLQIDAHVLVPRPETEGLVDWALELLDANSSAWPAPRVADLGTGSGAIALAIKQACPRAMVLATDCSDAALGVAQANATRLGLTLDLRSSHWWGALDGERFELVVANPPYIAGNDAHLHALRHEPRLALTPEGDGLAALHDIIDGAPAHLQRDGWLLLEHGHDQADAVAQRLAQCGFVDISLRPDLAGLARCSAARWPR